MTAMTRGSRPPKYMPIRPCSRAALRGMKIGLVKEGFQQTGAEQAVSDKVREAAKRLVDLGAKVEEISIPMHLLGPAIWTPIGTEGLTQTMMWGDGYGLSRSDLYSVSLMDFHRGWRQRANEMSETTKLFLMLGTYVLNNHGPRYYGKAMNINRRLGRCLRSSPGGARPAADANNAYEGDAAAPARGEPRGVCAARTRDDHQYRTFRH